MHLGKSGGQLPQGNVRFQHLHLAASPQIKLHSVRCKLSHGNALMPPTDNYGE